jgi:Na+/H+ antiporter NhaD/arsenite permease-like protein
MLFTAIVALFIVGYLCIALEHVLKVNKAATALLMFVGTWTLLMVGGPAEFFPGSSDLVHDVVKAIEHHLGEAGTTLFFLMGAMTIVEVVDQSGGFNFVRGMLASKSKKSLMWKVAFMTFILSAILDNLTTSIVMVMILRKLVEDRKDRIIYASLVIIAANSGGAFSPIGDVTTIMIWNKGFITAGQVIMELFVPSLVSMVVPAFLLSFMLKGDLPPVEDKCACEGVSDLTRRQRQIVFAVGVGGLIFVPIFKSITHLPPFVGILLVLGLLWTVTEIFYRHLPEHSEECGTQKRITNILSRIDMATILFFLGILMAVGCLQEIGALKLMGEGLNTAFAGNNYLITGIIGVLSSVVDNVPLVAGCLGMYSPEMGGEFVCDGMFWQLLAYCAGVGGSMLIIGSAAGVVVMGLEKISFGWYMKNISWVVLVGYLAGIATYWVERALFF